MADLSQQQKAREFYDLHHIDRLLILPNIWDPLGAMLLQRLGYPAVATASASIAFSNGYDDGENIPFNDLLVILKNITRNVHIPVSADIEKGFAQDKVRLSENIRQLIDTGVVGINIEDTDKTTNTLLTIEAQCEKIQLIRQASNEMGVHLFINARTDVYLRPGNLNTVEFQLEEAVRRGQAYKRAGADGFYPIALTRGDDIKKMVEQVQLPINVITIPGLPELDELQKMGVARVSLGPSFLKIAIQSMKKLATQLQKYEGLTSITQNEITSQYLKDLVNRKE